MAKNRTRKTDDGPAIGSQLTKTQEKEAINRVMELMAIPGGSGDELAVADYIRDQLIGAGANGIGIGKCLLN